MPGARGVRGARARGARAVRRVGRADRGRARGAHGPGPPPADPGVERDRTGPRPTRALDQRPKERFCTNPGTPQARRAHVRHRAGRPCGASARGGPRQLGPASPRPPGTRARSGRVSATISRSTAGSTVTVRTPLARTDSTRELRQDGDAEPRADQADHRRIVVGREVDARGEARALAHLAPAGGGSAGSPRSRAPSASSPMPTDPRAASRCPSGTSPTSRSVSSGRTTRSSHSPAPRPPPLVAEGERHVAVALAQHLDRARRLGLDQGDPGAGVRRRAGRRGRSAPAWSCRWGRRPAGPGRRAARRWRRPPPRPR